VCVEFDVGCATPLQEGDLYFLAGGEPGGRNALQARHVSDLRVWSALDLSALVLEKVGDIPPRVVRCRGGRHSQFGGYPPDHRLFW